MSKKFMCTWIIVLILSAVPQVFGETELNITASELAKCLANVTQITTISGKAELKVPADRGIVKMRVVTEHENLNDAITLNRNICNSLRKTLEKSGIAGDRIKASNFSSTPQYGWFGKSPSSYEVESQVKVTVINNREFREVAQAIDDHKKIHYAGIEFEHSEKEQLKMKVLALACDKVIEKQKIFEEKFGIKLKLKKLNESTYLTTYSADENINVSVHQRLDKSVDVLPFGEIIFTVQITGEFTTEY